MCDLLISIDMIDRSILQEINDVKPQTDVVLIDRAGLINSHPPRTSKTLDEYAKQDILPKVSQYSSKYIIFDVYYEESQRQDRNLGKRSEERSQHQL